MKLLRTSLGCVAAAGLALAALAAPVRADDAPFVAVALSPPGMTVAPGSEFDLEIDATIAGLPFNGFSAVIGYDPAALTLLPSSPLSLQEGLAMTGACGNTFHVFHAGAASDTISDILLCGGVALSGPGQLYRLHFRASSTPQVTEVQFLGGPKFYNEGLYVKPVVFSNTAVGIGMPVTTGVGIPAQVPHMSMHVAPNPGRGALQFLVQSDRGGPQALRVYDTHGRLVRRWAGEHAGSSPFSISWDGRDDSGGKLPPGLYFATLSAAGTSITSRFTLIP